MPDDPSQLREEALCLWDLQRYSECGESLQAYLDAAPAAPDAQDVRACAVSMMYECGCELSKFLAPTWSTSLLLTARCRHGA